MSTGMLYQKKKYWSKVLKESAIMANTFRSADTLRIFSERAWAESMYFIWLNVSSLFIFGLEPYEMEPLDPEYNVELPSAEEFAQGIKLRLIPKDVGKAYLEFYWDVYHQKVPPLLDFLTLVLALCYPEYFGWLSQLKKRKLIVGESVYGTSYVDPPVIRDFIRSGLYELAKRRMDFERIRGLFKLAVDKGFVSEPIAESIFNRMVLHFNAIYDTFILGFNLLGYSKLGKRKSEKASLYITTWKGEILESKIQILDEINVGFILGVSPLGLGILVPRTQIYKPSPRSETPIMCDFIDWKVRRMINRYVATGVAYGSYNRPEESFDFHKSERADQYYQIRLYYHHLDRIVENALADKDIDPFRLNMYKRAVAMLVGHKKKRHKWGYSVYKSMSEEEFKEWWLGYWVRQGLDINILNKLYKLVIRWVKPARSRVEDLGRRLAERRKQLAQVL